MAIAHVADVTIGDLQKCFRCKVILYRKSSTSQNGYRPGSHVVETAVGVLHRGPDVLDYAEFPLCEPEKGKGA